MGSVAASALGPHVGTHVTLTPRTRKSPSRPPTPALAARLEKQIPVAAGLGGTLWQDLPSQRPGDVEHSITDVT